MSISKKEYKLGRYGKFVEQRYILILVVKPSEEFFKRIVTEKWAGDKKISNIFVNQSFTNYINGVNYLNLPY